MKKLFSILLLAAMLTQMPHSNAGIHRTLFLQSACTIGFIGAFLHLYIVQFDFSAVGSFCKSSGRSGLIA